MTIRRTQRDFGLAGLGKAGCGSSVTRVPRASATIRESTACSTLTLAQSVLRCGASTGPVDADIVDTSFWKFNRPLFLPLPFPLPSMRMIRRDLNRIPLASADGSRTAIALAIGLKARCPRRRNNSYDILQGPCRLGWELKNR